jgi:hypothetical protein
MTSGRPPNSWPKPSINWTVQPIRSSSGRCSATRGPIRNLWPPATNSSLFPANAMRGQVNFETASRSGHPRRLRRIAVRADAAFRATDDLRGAGDTRRGYNLGNLWRRLVLPTRIDTWSLTSLRPGEEKTQGARSVREMSSGPRRRTDAGPPKGRHHGAIAATENDDRSAGSLGIIRPLTNDGQIGMAA